jgi:hypothetical protein
LPAGLAVAAKDEVARVTQLSATSRCWVVIFLSSP